MIINSNIDAMKSLRSLNNNTRKMDKNMEKLSSGMKINRAADDSAGLSISTKMRAQIRGLAQDERNIDDGVSLFNLTDGALGTLDDLTKRIRELAIQASNDTCTDADRTKMNAELNQLIDKIDEVSRNSEFNTIKVLQGDYSGKNIYRSNGSIDTIGNLLTNADTLRHNIYQKIDLKFPDGSTDTVYFGLDQYVYQIDPNFHDFLVEMYDPKNLNPDGTVSQMNKNYFLNTMIDALQLGFNDVGYPNLEVIGGYDANDHIGLGFKDGTIVDVPTCANPPSGYTGTPGITGPGTGTGTPLGHDFFHMAFTSSSQRVDMDLYVKKEMYIQVGANTDQGILFKWNTTSAKQLGLSDATFVPRSEAEKTIAKCDYAMDYIADIRGVMGAAVNRLESAKSGVNNYHENISAAESRIRDTNISKEMTEQVKNNILMQSATAMLAQANQRPENILQILR